MNQKIVIMGLGLFGGGVAATQYFVEQGAQVLVTDLRKPEDLHESLAMLKSLPVQLRLGEHCMEDFLTADCIIVNPGVPDSSPYLTTARKHGIKIDTEINIVLRNTPAPVIGITGSNGKSTTTAMIAHIFKTAGYTTWLGGNIGTSLLLELNKMKPSDWVVLELSSFQLDRVDGISPHVAVVTNISPNHLDRHGTMENYTHAKQNIIRFQKPSDVCILNARLPDLESWKNLTPGRTLIFGDQSSDVCSYENKICYRQQDQMMEIIPIEKLSLTGWANQENAMSASAVALSQNIPTTVIAQALSTFVGLPHRLQFLGEFLGRRIYEDSDATTPESTMVAIDSLHKPIILIAGGSDKGFQYDLLGQKIANEVKVLILMGQNASKIRASVEKFPHTTQIYNVPDLEAGVKLARSVSQQGDTITLSPAAASFGMFRNFVERAQIFQKLIQDYFQP